MPFSKEPKGIQIKGHEIEGYVKELHESKAHKKKEGYHHEFIRED